MNAVSIIPVGTVTFLFTDLEGSTRTWEQQGRAMSTALARHDAIVRLACSGNNGYVFKTLGDAFCVAFGAAHDALAAAIDLQLGLLAEDWKSMGMATPLSLRLALHTGPVETRDGDYFGPTLNRTSRLLATAHGGQSLLSEATAVMVREHLLGNMMLKGLGEHRLKDLQRAESVYQLVCPPLPVDFPPLRSLEGRPHNLPLQLTLFVGRETALADAATRLRDPGTRLLTLLGPGGTGKTRIALQLAAESLHDFTDGAFFVALDPVRDSGHVAHSISSGLGVQVGSGRDPGEALIEHLRGKHQLLVLDNFEQVVEAASLVGELLRNCPQLKVVVTSREALRIAGERVVPVHPLDLPPLSPIPDLHSLLQYEAVRVFIDRAMAVKPDFAVTSANAPAVAEICHRLDGLPLAIELAAARIRMFEPEPLLARLRQGLGALLTGGSRDATVRQRTLKGAISWSVDLLSPDERTLFARLGVFFGSFTYEAAEAVGSDSQSSGFVGETDVLSALEGLLDKSLLRRHGGVGSESRVRLLETIREFALDEVQSGGMASVARDQHLGHYMGLAETCGPHLGGPDQLEFYERLEADRDNLFHAMDWASSVPVDAHRASSGMRLFVAANQFWNMRTRFSRLLHPVTRLMLAIDPLIPGSTAMANPVSGIPNGLLARFRWACSDMHRGNPKGWEVPVLEAAIVVLREAGDAKYSAWALNRLSNILSGSGSDLSVATAYASEAAALFRQIGDSYGEAESVHRVAMNEIGCGNTELGMEMLYQSLATAQRQRDSASVSKSRWILTCAELKVGNLDAAEAIAELLILDQSTYGFWGYSALAESAIFRHDLDVAIARVWNLHRRASSDSASGPTAHAYRLLAEAYRLTGDLVAAEGHVAEGELISGRRLHRVNAQIALAKGDRVGARQDLRFALSEFSDDIFWSTMPAIILEVAGLTASVDPARAARLASLSRGLTARGERWPVYPQDVEQIRAILLAHGADPDLAYPDPMPGEAEVVSEALAALEFVK